MRKTLINPPSDHHNCLKAKSYISRGSVGKMREQKMRRDENKLEIPQILSHTQLLSHLNNIQIMTAIQWMKPDASRHHLIPSEQHQ